MSKRVEVVGAPGFETEDFLLPKQARYRAAPRPDIRNNT